MNVDFGPAHACGCFRQFELYICIWVAELGSIDSASINQIIGNKFGDLGIGGKKAVEELGALVIA